MRNDSDLPSAIRRLLFEAGLEVDPPYERRIFTNRDLNFDAIPVVGFDMDYTLAMYNQEAMEEVSIACTVDKLLSRGYPGELKDAAPDPRFAIRGLMVDKVLGNVLKQDRHGYVGRVFHGRSKLSRDERKATYRAQRLGQERERFAPVDTLFALPEVTLYAQMVEFIDRRPDLWNGSAPSYGEAWADVRACIDEAHRDGSIKEQIKANPGRYIVRDPDLAATLHKFRSAGKRLFLLTNSLFPYTDAVMHHLLDGSLASYGEWRAYFDWVVVGSRKPEFFTHGRAFQELDDAGNPVGSPKQRIQRGKVYSEGNQIGLQESIGVHGDEVVYVGDHIYGDIVRSKKSSGWRTALIVQELEQDLQVRRTHGLMLREIENLYRLRSELATAVSAQRHLSRTLARLSPEELIGAGLTPETAAKALDDARNHVRRRFDGLRRYQQQTTETLEERATDVDEAFNPYWGSAFAERYDTSRFGAQVEFYACIYTSRVSNFLYVSPSTYFHSPHGWLPHWSNGS